jgi:predicted homoserine dehydrogenase-like protein
VLDGEGGYTVWGRLMPAERSVAAGALPIGLAKGVRLKRAIAEDETIRLADVELPADSQAVRLRRAMVDAAGFAKSAA